MFLDRIPFYIASVLLYRAIISWDHFQVDSAFELVIDVLLNYDFKDGVEEFLFLIVRFLIGVKFVSFSFLGRVQLQQKLNADFGTSSCT